MKYEARTELPVGVSRAFAYHQRPGCLERLIPPWESVTIADSDGSLEPGSRVVLKTRLFGVPLTWVAQHTRYEPPRLFADTQLSGPFARWDHEHRFDPIGDDAGDAAAACQLTDRIEFRLPGGSLGKRLGAGKARRTIESMFAYRHRVTRDDLQLDASHPMEPKTIAVSGSSGLVGSSLCQLLTLLGHRVLKIVRSPSDAPDELAVWDTPADAARLAEADAVVHLAGKSIADKRWTDRVKAEIRDSRVIKTAHLCEALARLDRKPEVLISVSATGIYGDRGDEVLTETSPPGDDFLAGVAEEWEAACDPARDAGIRVVHPRLGIVLSPRGGALAKMLTPAKCFGGALGDGSQWWSWIALDDVVGGIYHAIVTDTLQGPVNFVAPDPLRNRDFAQILGRVVGRPALLPAPAFALRMALGEMADALLLASTRVSSAKLSGSGYHFRFPELQPALRYLLGTERLESVG